MVSDIAALSHRFRSILLNYWRGELSCRSVAASDSARCSRASPHSGKRSHTNAHRAAAAAQSPLRCALRAYSRCTPTSDWNRVTAKSRSSSASVPRPILRIASAPFVYALAKKGNCLSTSSQRWTAPSRSPFAVAKLANSERSRSLTPKCNRVSLRTCSASAMRSNCVRHWATPNGPAMFSNRPCNTCHRRSASGHSRRCIAL